MVGYWLDCNSENQSDSGCIPRPISCGHKSCLDKHHSLEETRSLESRPKFRGDRRSLSLLDKRSQVMSHKLKQARKQNALAPEAAAEQPHLERQMTHGTRLLQTHAQVSHRSFVA